MFKSQKARDAKDRLETVASQAQKMNDIVTEQWIQIQRLEQAFHSTQILGRCEVVVLNQFSMDISKIKFDVYKH
ncbi:hypothetical protein COP2_029423 [Malus domestica]